MKHKKERAISSGFIGSNGEKFKTELPTQKRVVVDEKSKELNLFYRLLIKVLMVQSFTKFR